MFLWICIVLVLQCVYVSASRYLNAVHVLSNWWKCFLNLVVFCLFACVFLSWFALSSQGHSSLVFLWPPPPSILQPFCFWVVYLFYVFLLSGFLGSDPCLCSRWLRFWICPCLALPCLTFAWTFVSTLPAPFIKSLFISLFNSFVHLGPSPSPLPHDL